MTEQQEKISKLEQSKANIRADSTCKIVHDFTVTVQINSKQDIPTAIKKIFLEKKVDNNDPRLEDQIYVGDVANFSKRSITTMKKEIFTSVFYFSLETVPLTLLERAKSNFVPVNPKLNLTVSLLCATGAGHQWK